MKASHFGRLLYILLTGVLLTSCNKSLDEEIKPEPSTVNTLELTVTGSSVQAPFGNAYLFYSEEADLDYALGYGDGKTVPLIDVSKDFSPVIRYYKDGQEKVLTPVSPFGTRNDGELDNYSSVRYSQVKFNIPSLLTTYGKVQKGSVVLVLIVLNDPQSRSCVARTIQLRRDYLIHISLPDHKDRSFVADNELNAKWWQVEE